MESLKKVATLVSSVVGYCALTIGLALSVQLACAEEVDFLPSDKVVCAGVAESECQDNTAKNDCAVPAKTCKKSEGCGCSWDATVKKGATARCKCMK